MTPVPISLGLRPDGFDVERIRCQDRGNSVLVMDRVSGNWLALDREWAPLIPLLGAWREAGPFAESVKRLRAVLIEHSVGVVGSERRFIELNTLIVKLTAHCNHACAYCYDFEPTDANTIDPDVAIDVISQALDRSNGGLQVILHGGEPMLVWPLVERIVLGAESRAAGNGKRLRFVGQTNMSRLNVRVRDFSNAHDIVWGVSVDGPPEIHDRFRTYRSGRGTYVDFEHALQRFPRFVTSCGVLSTITAANDKHLLAVCRHFRDLGMASWDWSLFQPIGRGRGAAELFAPRAENVLDSWDELFDAVLAGEFDGFPVQPVLKYVKNFLHGPGANMCMRPECGAARDLLSLSADGTIEACDCIDTRGPLANLGHAATDSVGDALECAKAQQIRGRDLTATRCSDCIWWGVCGGGCMARAEHRDAIPALECAISLNAFDRIAERLVEPAGPMRRYLGTLEMENAVIADAQ